MTKSAAFIVAVSFAPASNLKFALEHDTDMFFTVLPTSTTGKRRTRPATKKEQDEQIEKGAEGWDFWPEGKAQPLIITSCGTDVGFGWSSEYKRGPPVFIDMEQYYNPGEYAEAMATAPKLTPKERAEHPDVRLRCEKLVLGEQLDPLKPCYVKHDRHDNADMGQFWSYVIPLTKSQYWQSMEPFRKQMTVRKFKCNGHPGQLVGQVKSIPFLAFEIHI